MCASLGVLLEFDDQHGRFARKQRGRRSPSVRSGIANTVRVAVNVPAKGCTGKVPTVVVTRSVCATG